MVFLQQVADIAGNRALPRRRLQTRRRSAPVTAGTPLELPRPPTNASNRPKIKPSLRLEVGEFVGSIFDGIV